MKYDWNLEKIYPGLDSEEFKKDLEEGVALSKKALEMKLETLEDFREFTLLNEKASLKIYSLFNYISLRLSVNTEDLEAMKVMGKMDSVYEEIGAPLSIKEKNFVKEHKDIIEKAYDDEVLKDYSYYLDHLKNGAKRSLSNETELLLSKLAKSSGDAWENLHSDLTSTLEVDYNGEVVSLSEIRNNAYSPDPKVRKESYEAELKAYKKIEKPLAASLSSIKQEVLTLSKERGYDSPLDQTLIETGMTRKTLDALISSIEEYYPYFRMYLKRKGELLGHKNGLPFYDLFAPMGKVNTKYSIEEANAYLVDRFSKFSKEIGGLMKKAMDNEWIDYLPKKGKVGGAFCSEVFKLGESRVLTNFDGTFNSICTLAHELGHAYHGEVIKDKSLFHQDYPMQLAETASTFNETFAKDNALKEAKSKEEKIAMLEATISDDNQVIVDIMSRYYFETSVFENVKEAALTAPELCDLMKEAQLKSYGDGLDKDYLHPYMWCPKGHYYSTGLSFYNFPYAFGQLFAYGLYSKYLEEGEKFFPLYKEILKNSGSMPIRECVLLSGIDVEDKEFWKRSLDICKKHILEFLELTE